MSNPATTLIKAEMSRLRARKAQLETGVPEHQKEIEAQQQCIQSLNDEIQWITSTLDGLQAACRKLERR